MVAAEKDVSFFIFNYGTTEKHVELQPICFNKSYLDLDVCSSNGMCMNSEKCVCFDGYYGPQCEFSYDCSNLNNCSINGICAKDGVCQCSSHAHGDDCSIPVWRLIPLFVFFFGILMVYSFFSKIGLWRFWGKWWFGMFEARPMCFRRKRLWDKMRMQVRLEWDLLWKSSRYYFTNKTAVVQLRLLKAGFKDFFFLLGILFHLNLFVFGFFRQHWNWNLCEGLKFHKSRVSFEPGEWKFNDKIFHAHTKCLDHCFYDR